jgi:hypothetical protein
VHIFLGIGGKSISNRDFRKGISNAHSQGLGGSTASDLLDAELAQLELQLIELLGEIILALAPELTSLDLGRLSQTKPLATINSIAKSS